MKFGTYFKKERESRKITQQMAAEALGKTTMMISGVESGKNGPFSEKDLKKLSILLNLDEKEQKEMLWVAARERGKMPNYLNEYLDEHKELIELLDRIATNKLNTNELKEIIDYIDEINEVKHV